MKKVNLREELENLRGERLQAERLMGEVYDILANEAVEDQLVLNAIYTGRGYRPLIDQFKLDHNKIFSLKEIRELCINYRLRFLDPKYFKAPIPFEAINEVKRILDTEYLNDHQFKILAPSVMFQLEDCQKDPLLFLQLADDKYYLIHQWGGEMNWFRKIMCYPLRNFKSLLKTVLVFCGLITIFIPSDILILREEFGFFHSLPLKVLFFVWTFTAIASVLSFVGFTFFNNFSEEQWNSRYFNE